MARFVYLHGFASSPDSAKARVFRERLTARGHEVAVPPLDEGDFTGLTITRQLAVVRRVADRIPGPLSVVGSSMGGYLAALFAASGRRAERMVLMAPAVGLRESWLARYGPARVDAWRREGRVMVFHHGSGFERPVGFGLYEDMARHDPFPPVAVPALVFMGRKDDTVDPAAVERWCADNPRATLRWLDAGHALTDFVETIWRESAQFLGVAG